jgi:hypothetical protein
VSLLTTMCGFLGGTIVNASVDAATGYTTTETGPPLAAAPAATDQKVAKPAPGPHDPGVSWQLYVRALEAERASPLHASAGPA